MTIRRAVLGDEHEDRAVAATMDFNRDFQFGGVKASGYGRFGGKAAVDEFTELRWVTIQTTPRHYPF